MLSVNRVWGIAPPIATLLRNIAVCGLAYGFAVLWFTPGLLFLLKMSVIALIIIFLFFLCGEFSYDKMSTLRSLLLGKYPANRKEI